MGANGGDAATRWEMVHHLIRALEADGESAAGELSFESRSKAEVARELAYRFIRSQSAASAP